MTVSERTRLLLDAEHITTQDRNNHYGPPTQDFTRTAQLWASYLNHPIQPHDVAAMMILLKISRISWSPHVRDHWLDIAGYAACGYETTQPN